VTTNIVYAAAGDGYLVSTHTSYSSMFNGTTVSPVTGTSVGFLGRNEDGSDYQGFETFMTFTYSIPTDQVTASSIRVKVDTMNGAATARNLRFVQYAYGTLGAVDWRTPTQIAALSIIAEALLVQNGSVGKYVTTGSDGLTLTIKAIATLELVAVTTNLLSGSPPTFNENASIVLSEATGTANDPALVYTTVARSRLWPVLGAQVQLSDGSWCYLESDGLASPVVLLRHCTTGGTVTPVATIPTGTGGTDFSTATDMGMQGIALCVDSANNLYVLGKVGNADNSLAAKAYVKGVGYTWSAQTTRSWPLVAHDSQINGVAAVWQSTASGTIMAAFGHGPGALSNTASPNDVAYALLDATYLRTGAGSLMRSHDSAVSAGLQSGDIHPADFSGYVNEAGTGLDVAWAGTGNTSWGYLASFQRTQNLGDNDVLYPGRYILNSSGDALTHASVRDAGYATKDAAAKVRTIRTSSSTVAYVSTDADTGYGLTIVVLQYSGTSSGGVSLAYKRLADAGITNMPDGPAVSIAAWWDAVYNSVSNTLEIYYRDSVSARILRRTTFSLTTMLPLANSVLVYTAPSGTAEIQAIRVQRGADAGTTGLVCLAVKDAAVLTLVNVIETYNLAPTAPTLTPRANYDATAAATFAWTFNDPNAGDTQSAYQLIIERTDTGATVVDSGKVASATSSRNVTGGTLTNALSYRWKVRTYDTADAVSPYSGYGTFSTAAGGTVTITDPVADNPAGVITDDYQISWSVAGTTQAGYRVWLIRTDTGATVNDSGWIASVAVTRLVSGMASGVEHRVEVKVRNAALVESATGTRLITPDYGSPEVPLITVTADDAGGFVLVSVDNPAPTGDKPEVVRNDVLRRRVGGTTWTLVGTADPDGTFRDYTAPAGIPLEYVARGTSA
jgi:hypothetical protein